MTTTTANRLERLRNHATLYELAMSRGTERFLIAYTSRKGRTDIWGAVTSDKRVKAIIARTGTETIHFAKKSADGATIGEWSIRFTGRTEREALIEGALPYVGA